MLKYCFLFFFNLILISIQAQKSAKKDYLITIETSGGTMHAILFDDTPKHKSNFIKLAENKFYDSTLFHRVIKEFMIQGGDPTSKNAKPGDMLGAGGGDLKKIPYEFTPKHVHIQGTLAAARTNNPEKESSGSQFYIVTGKKYTAQQIQQNASRSGMNYTEQQIKDYQEKGGTPFLDNNYTVFGELIDGLEVALKIQETSTGAGDRPNEDISMNISAKLLKKKKIAKLYNYHFSS